uniref:Enoyl reductase (ER) domain-containing protein n=1 Tax=Arcella intermedia TaxID=1963864 RepID=A0A6B2L8X4_9EUKA
MKELRQFHFESRAVPRKPRRGNVVVRIHTVGICGSDVHYWAHGRCGPFVVNGPLVLGHECSGIIVEVGEGVSNVAVGDRVAIEPGVPCRVCKYCRSGKYNLCPDVVFLATPPVDGSLANYIEHAADFCYKMPDHMSFEEGALLEPLSVGVQACRRGGVAAGSHVLITGAGPVGLVSLLVAKASGATRVVVTDLMQNRLDVAKQLGADATFLSNDPRLLEKLAAFAPITQTLECSGAEAALTLAIRATCPGGKVLSIGRSAHPTQNIPLFEAADREVDICGSFRYHDTYPTALELVATGKVNVRPLVTHRFNLLQSQQAFETAEVGKDGAIKVAIQVADAKL